MSPISLDLPYSAKCKLWGILPHHLKHLWFLVIKNYDQDFIVIFFFRAYSTAHKDNRRKKIWHFPVTNIQSVFFFTSPIAKYAKFKFIHYSIHPTLFTVIYHPIKGNHRAWYSLYIDTVYPNYNPEALNRVLLVSYNTILTTGLSQNIEIFGSQGSLWLLVQISYVADIDYVCTIMFLEFDSVEHSCVVCLHKCSVSWLNRAYFITFAHFVR